MSKLTVEALKTATGVTGYQLQQKCMITHLKKITIDVGNYPQFASKFDLPPAILSGIENHTPKLTYAQMTEEVFLWWRENNENVTYFTFVQACLELGKGGIARTMCEMCKGTITINFARGPVRCPEFRGVRHAFGGCKHNYWLDSTSSWYKACCPLSTEGSAI